MRTEGEKPQRSIERIAIFKNPQSICAVCELSTTACEKCGFNHPPNRKEVKQIEMLPQKSSDWYQDFAGIAKEGGL